MSNELAKERYKRYRSKPGVKERQAEYQRQQRALFPDKFRERSRKSERRRKLRKYGLTEDEYNNILLSQSNLCAICENENTNKRDWHIDHCHQSGKVRGLLCHQCNLLLGQARDDISILRKAIEYLEDHS